ncbi:carboxysome shell carbonic anhydrase domain-containg protein [Marinobacter changyiensis]|uniref:carboxysome shell carbonic anhydrase domain-containg protein n=1 Tax=Marinobacter changyiensis TaxID=2604091 RepID=UPI0012655375|nr:carboxysome shell carbonic anhydrase domain-containg protein [Marinobacter changyiensis]
MSTAIHIRPIQERMNWLMDLSRTHSAQFCSPESHLARQRYLAEHSTLIVALKCMDGRIHLPYVTQTPLGIIRPFRNLGGIFDLGWPYLGDMLADAVGEAVREGRRVLIIITYHYSKGLKARGCAGFACDREAAIAHAYGIRSQVEQIFGRGHQTVYPMVCGFETDEDALILHGLDDRQYDLSVVPEKQMDALIPQLSALYPDMPAQVRGDLLPLVCGNIRHIAEIRQSERELDIEHREWVICLGRGFDFLHVPNVALIIGPYSPDLAHPIRQAATIIRANMESGRIPDDGFLLLSSSPYHEPGPQQARAALKSRFLAGFATSVIREEFPDLMAGMITRTATLNWPERRLDVLQEDPQGDRIGERC